MNPWLRGRIRGGSAGPGAATAAALVGFAIGSETEGSIVDPCMRCGVTGLRPTFGRVPRTGAMTLCWSMDKLGPMTRGVEDAMLVLAAISGPDPGDLSSVPCRLDFDSGLPVKGLQGRILPGLDEREPGDGGGSRGARDGPRPRDGAGRGEPPRLALRVARHGSVRRGRGRVRGAYALARTRRSEDAGSGRVAEHVPPVAFPVRGRFRPGGPPAPQGGARDGPHLREGGSPAGPVAARRDPHRHELHRPPVARAASGVRRGDRARSDWAPDPAHPLRGSPQSASAARGVPHRPALRRGDDRRRRNRSRARVRRGGERPPGF